MPDIDSEIQKAVAELVGSIPTSSFERVVLFYSYQNAEFEVSGLDESYSDGIESSLRVFAVKKFLKIRDLVFHQCGVFWNECVLVIDPYALEQSSQVMLSFRFPELSETQPLSKNPVMIPDYEFTNFLESLEK
jgi:hypothetical protein